MGEIAALECPFRLHRKFENPTIIRLLVTTVDRGSTILTEWNRRRAGSGPAGPLDPHVRHQILWGLVIVALLVMAVTSVVVAGRSTP